MEKFADTFPHLMASVISPFPFSRKDKVEGDINTP
jgi:hypothetical protein